MAETLAAVAAAPWSSQASWITTMGGGADSANASYSVAPNAAGIPRTGSITIPGRRPPGRDLVSS